jgi:hypothetical protein
MALTLLNVSLQEQVGVGKGHPDDDCVEETEVPIQQFEEALRLARLVSIALLQIVVS